MSDKDKCGQGGCELNQYIGTCDNCGDIIHKDDNYAKEEDLLLCEICKEWV